MRHINLFFSLLFLLCAPSWLSAQAVNEWVQTNGPEGGEVKIFRRNSGTIYAGTTSNGIWKSTDEGETWSYVHSQFNRTQVQSIEVYDSNIFVLCTRSFSANQIIDVVLFISHDDGSTWSQRSVRHLISGPYFNSNSSRFWKDGNRLWVSGNSRKLAFSDDDGQNWSTIIVPGNDNLSGAISKGDTLFVIENNLQEITTSINLGSDWSSYTTNLPSSSSYNMYYDNDYLIVSSYDSTYVSSDFGLSWEISGIPYLGYFGDFGGLTKQPDGSYIIINGAIIKTYDLVDWITIGNSIPYDSIAEFIGQPSIMAGNELIIGKGPSKTRLNMSSIEKAATGFFYTFVDDISVLNNGDVIANDYFLTKSLYVYNSNDEHWSPLNGPPYTIFHQCATQGDTLWAVGGDRIYRFTPADSLWYDAYGPVYNDLNNHPIRIFGNSIYVINYGSVLKSTNRGVTWDLIWPADPLQSITDVLEYNNYLFYITDYGALYRSIDNGGTWDLVFDFNAVDPLYEKNRLGIMDGVLFIWSIAKSYSSTDLGTTFTELDMYGLPVGLFSATAFGPNDIQYNNNRIYCTTNNHGVYVSLDRGHNWQPFNEGLGSVHARKIAFKDSIMYLSTYGAGVWKRSIGGLETLSGQVYNDLNNNGQFDVNETILPGVVIYSDQTNIYTTPDPFGTYRLIYSPDLDTVRIQSVSPYCTINPPYHVVNQSGSGYDFGIHFQPGIIDIGVDLTAHHVFRPGFLTNLTITIYNRGTANNQSGTGFLPIPNGISIVPSSLGTAYVQNDTLFFNYSGLGLFESQQINISVQVSPTAAIGDVLTFTVHTNTPNDIQIANDTYTLTDIIVGAYDPNDKLAVATLSPQELAAGKPIEYTIRFENIGNFYAERVIITDIIEANLDLQTFRQISSSHPCTWRIKDGRTLEFTFDSIFLQPQETGFVKFSLTANRALQLNQSVSNTASIYFDFNAPIITNTIKTTIQEPSSTHTAPSPIAIRISPNPTNQYALVEVAPTDLPRIARIRVSDVSGKLLLDQQPAGTQTRLDLTTAAAGTHQVIILDKDGQVLASEPIVVVR
jgi:uncharacterized repeat protein (TIGR01451 family)